LGSAGVFADTFPGLPTEGLTATASRPGALVREERQFLTWDHPLVTGALDLIIGSEKGNSSFAQWPDTSLAALYLEALFLIECIAPPHLHVDRFLPPTPVRVLVDHHSTDAGALANSELLSRVLKPENPHRLLEQPDFRLQVLPAMLEAAEKLASSQLSPLIARARAEMTTQLDHELARLRELQKVNRNVRAEEVELLVEQERALDQHLSGARLRLDAVRLIRRGPAPDRA
jgi:ATP-dependent helicase HepA